MKTPAELVGLVTKCVEDGAAEIKAKGDKGLMETVDDGAPRLDRLYDLAYGLIAHSNEHYGQLVVFIGSTAWCRRNQGTRNREVLRISEALAPALSAWLTRLPDNEVQIDVANRDCHQLSRFEIGGGRGFLNNYPGAKGWPGYNAQFPVTRLTRIYDRCHVSRNCTSLLFG